MTDTITRLLEQALDALRYHTEQTRPIEKTEKAIVAIESALAAPAQAARLEALKVDAERYRFLRSEAHKDSSYDRFGPDGCYWNIGLYGKSAEGLDAAVDKALNKKTAPQPMQSPPLTVENIRDVGGIVHKDGNIFFTNIEQANRAMLAAREVKP